MWGAQQSGSTGREAAMGTHAETFSARRASTRGGIIVGAVVLLLAALGVGVMIGRATEATTKAAPATRAAGLASPQVVQALDSNVAAWNAADTAAIAAAYAPNAVVTDTIAGMETVGADKIASVYMKDTLPGDWQLQRVSEVVQIGGYSANAFTYANGSGIAVYQLDDNLKIVHQWIMGV